MNDQESSQDDFTEDDANNLRDGQAGGDKREKGDEENGAIPDRRKKFPKQGPRRDPKLDDTRYEKTDGRRNSPTWPTDAGLWKYEEQFTPEQLEQFSCMPIRPLGRKILDLSKSFELFSVLAQGFESGFRSYSEVSRELEARQNQGTYPIDLPVSHPTLHRAVAELEAHFKTHFKLNDLPRLVVREGDGMPVSRLTGAGKVALVLIREYLASMGYDDVWHTE